MPRLLRAVSEWLQLRTRLREERRFHLDCLADELRAIGFTERDAKRTARHRFGHRSFSLAASELGCDLPGLAHLFRIHRVLASAWVQPAALLSIILVTFLISPRPAELIHNILIRLHKLDTQGATILTLDAKDIWYVGTITGPEFNELQSMTTLTGLERYRGSYAWGHAAPGATLQAIVSEARRKTGNDNLSAEFIPSHLEILANPAQSIWLVIACGGAFLLFRRARQFRTSNRHLLRWLLYGIGVAALHATASLAAWAFLLQMGTQLTIGLAFLFIAWLGIAAIQCRYWWMDFSSRCPLCFEPMLLPLTEGSEGSMVIRPAVTEWVCANGHGVLVESRWSRTFRPEQSPLESLANFS